MLTQRGANGLPTSLSVEKAGNLVDDMAAGPDDKHMTRQ